jgi:hypothetical protein
MAVPETCSRSTPSEGQVWSFRALGGVKVFPLRSSATWLAGTGGARISYDELSFHLSERDARGDGEPRSEWAGHAR